MGRAKLPSALPADHPGSFEARLEAQNIHFDDSFAHYAQAGKDCPAVIILHGWAASLKQWEWLLPILANAGYTAYAVDLPGHGQAPRLSDDHILRDYLCYLHQWMKTLEIQHPVLLGHSMGGYLSLQYALDHPQAVRGLILADPLYGSHQFYASHQLGRRLLGRPKMRRVGEFIFRHIPTWLIEASHRWPPPDISHSSAALRRQIIFDHRRADPRIVQTIALIDDLRPHLSQVTAPSLVTWGSRDQLLSPESFESLADLLPAAQKHCFVDVGHHPHLARTQCFIELVLTFLRRLDDNNGETETIPMEAIQPCRSSTTTILTAP
jgi:pimeloyl-ACP methyl ester carboxylesterase